MNLAGADDLVATFRDVMAGVCTPVSVVTAMDAARPHGTTVSAFASLSIDPPMILVSLDRGSDLLTLVRRGGDFGLNILASGQAELALRFARKGTDKFTDIDWAPSAGVPCLTGASGWVARRVTGTVDGGDHTIVLGEVIDAVATTHPPLTYHARAFGTHRPDEEKVR